jgi:hypothetical protein
MDEEALAAPGGRRAEHVGPDGEEGLGQGRGLAQDRPSGTGQAVGGGGQRLLGVAAAGEERADLGRRGQPRRRGPALHDARAFEAGEVGGAGRGRVAPARWSASGRFTPA